MGDLHAEALPTRNASFESPALRSRRFGLESIREMSEPHQDRDEEATGNTTRIEMKMRRGR